MLDVINQLIAYINSQNLEFDFKYLKDSNPVTNLEEADRIEIRSRCIGSKRYLTIIITQNKIVFYKSFYWDTVASKREAIFDVKEDLDIEEIKKNLEEIKYFE